MSLQHRLARLEDAYTVGVDYGSWPLGEQLLDAVKPVRERLLEGVREAYYGTDRELHIIAAASRYLKECRQQGRDSDPQECIEYVSAKLAEVGDRDPTPLLEEYALPFIAERLKRMPPHKQPQRERELYQYWLGRGPTVD